ncbi:uncharacterized protein LACBIDRAFT_315971 [Laccaria bicolor S238N-H82]|uniref:Predicted protein n=1 Tax=Laccaria bicolor (strain S238N-H82 / ATCC MYA-4686) TaxID=486041 RepID=B0D3L6_LACBS|nr:uncharacterized protein LACBIDRAFT_315971 [Laccaria bicolor S238N-H82]EDR10945.1 predicted protein [Laccaria bicolor S238N-H82]|eukprot:XP_001878246.1 predicted protein [Laccaria bicolor S238N-H82]
MFVKKLGPRIVSAIARRSQLNSRLLLSRFQSTAAFDGPPISETNRAEATKKRFWSTVGVSTQGDTLAITLDGRALKTPSGNTLLLPANKTLLASVIAAEWDNQETLLKPHALPMTSIASRAVDELEHESTRQEVRKALVAYLDTDTICFFNNYPEPLEKLQTQHWEPLLSWARETFGIQLNISGSILSVPQPEETKKIVERVLESLDKWEIAALERATYTTKSLIIALALVKNHLSVEKAALAAQVEVNSQIERWGEVEDTHDVDYHDVRRQLASAAILLSNS